MTNQTSNTAVPCLGIRNHNPLNIRYTAANRWLGLHPATPCVKGFCHFTTFDYGYRAAVILLKNYIRTYHLDTPAKLIARWAPPTENRTALYIAAVCGRSGLRRDEKILPNGPQLGRLIAAMARQESGIRITPEGVDAIRERFGV